MYSRPNGGIFCQIAEFCGWIGGKTSPRPGNSGRQVMIGASAAFSPNGSNWGGRGGCLGFLVYLFCGYADEKE